MSKEKDNRPDDASALRDALPPVEGTPGAEDIVEEILSGGTGYAKYLGDGAPAGDDGLGPRFTRHLAEDLTAHVSASPERAEPKRRRGDPGTREIYSDGSDPAPGIGADGRVVYPAEGVGRSHERVVYDADWEEQARRGAGRPAASSGAGDVGRAFRFAGAPEGEPKKTETSRRGASPAPSGTGAAASRGSERFSATVGLPGIGAEDPIKPRKALPEEEAALSESEKQIVDDAVLTAFSGDFSGDREFREKWAGTVAQAQQRREENERRKAQEESRRRSQKKLREREEQVAEDERMEALRAELLGLKASGVRVGGVDFGPRKTAANEEDLTEKIAVDDTPEEMIYKKTAGEKLSFSLKSRFSKEGLRRWLRSVFPVKGDGFGESLRKVVRMISLIALLSAVVYLGFYYYNYRTRINTDKTMISEIEDWENLTPEQIEDEWKKIRANYPDVVFPEGLRVQFARNYAVNQDLVGMLRIKGLGLETLILQRPDDDYYLYRDFYHQRSRYGYPFAKADSVLGRDYLSKNIIIYGHNTHDKLIFNKLEEYTDPATFIKYPIVTLDTLYATSKWKIFAVMLTNANPQDDNGRYFDYLYSEFNSNDHFMSVVNGVRQRSMIHTGVDVNENDRILMLYTCYRYQFNSGRLVVVARQLREGESELIDPAQVWYDSSAYFPAAYYGRSQPTTAAPALQPETLPPVTEEATADPDGPPTEETLQ